MTDRFRLIYLKSTGLEKSRCDESPLSLDQEKTPEKMCSSIKDETIETFSSQTILKQAKEDLRHPDPRVRIFAIHYFENADPSIAVPLLQEVLSDHDSGVRAQVLTSLVKFQNPVVFPLFKKYLKDSDVRVRMAALKGLFRFREHIELNLLLQLLSDESPWVRRKMATLLGWSQMEGALPILIELSKDQDPKVRKAALSSLITLYPEESESRLVDAMADSDPDLRKWVKRALENKMVGSSKKRTTLFQNRG
jgi:HEAT repeat protein